MALVNRISRLFTADMHAVLDRIEEPEALLRQALREMEEELVRGEQRVKYLQAEDQQLIAREGQIERSLVDIGDKLDLCFESGKEDLARAWVKRKLEAERLGKILAQRREGVASKLAAQRATLEENRSRLDGLRQKADALSAEGQAQAGEDDDWTAAAFPVGDEEVEVAFLAEKKRRARS